MVSELKKWAKAEMKGVENLLIPSFTPDLSKLDEKGIRWDVRQSIRHGFFCTLCTPEVGMTFDEAKQFIDIVTDEAKGKIVVATTVFFDSFEKNMEMLTHAEKAGCSHVLLGYPASFHPKSEEEVYQVTREMCASTRLGIVFHPSPHYNLSKFHPSGFPLDLLSRILDLENMVAIEVAEPGLMAEFVRLFNEKVVISCPIERWLPFLYQTYGQQCIGAGPYEILQSPDKPYLVEYFNLMRQGKMDQAMEIYWRLTPARVIFEMQHIPTAMLGTYHWTRFKYYQWLVGGNGGYTRQPSMKMHQHEMEVVKMALRRIGIDPRVPDEEFYVGRVNFETKNGKNGNASWEFAPNMANSPIPPRGN